MMVDELNIGEYRMLDNSFYQYPSFLVYKIKDITDNNIVIKKIVQVARKSPYNNISDFDEYIVDKNFAVISNSKPLDEHFAIQLIFEKMWDIFNR